MALIASMDRVSDFLFLFFNGSLNASLDFLSLFSTSY